MSKFDPYSHIGVALNPDGTLTRNLNYPTVEANPEPSPGSSTVSKDITINHENKTWVRIFRPTKLPSNDNTVARLPIFLFFHNGGFIHFTPASNNIHGNCSQIASEIPAIVVSVGFRLSPENRLPAAYYDGCDAVLWVKKQVADPDGEQWLRDYGDPSRCYLYGVGCGGNIVFNTAILLLEENLDPLRIGGIIMNQPMFGGVKRTASELKFATDQLLPLPVLDLCWELTLPKETNRDHRYCNPMIKGPHFENVKKLGRCLVIGFGGDIMVDKQQEFVTMLVKCGVQVEARFDQLGFHSIDMVDPVRFSAVMNIVKEFIL
ncbi:probable carboxylesterase 9 [Arachis stenosperma]|uniref:probable carboxylesterase 9 n=1 Tax=Arachis stenosperma TaxID=217475 RepID=UPI0025AD3E82|nr:probable carboxylesterase 9 [Arachis stenosperma]